MKITLIAFTKKGAGLCYKLTKHLSEKGYDTIGFSKYNFNGLNYPDGNIYDFTKNSFKTSCAIVYVGAIGIAVRAVAPFIISKSQDPGVVVVDEKGEYVIPILSGHLGGANELAVCIAELIKAKALITTATDINNMFAVDLWAKKNGLYIDNVENIKYVSSAILKGQKIGFYCEFPLDGKLPNFLTSKEAEAGICIYDSIVSKKEIFNFKKVLFMRPKKFVVGAGCRKGTDESIFEGLFLETLSKLNIPAYLVKCISTIDIKKEEKAIKSLCEKYRYQLKIYSSGELSMARGDFTPSKFVKRITGVDNVCERAAFLASDAGEFILRKTAKNGITIAVAVKKWRCRF